MAKYGLAIDVSRCTGCYSCFLACKDEFVGNDYPPLSVAQPDSGLSWIVPQEVEYGAGDKVKLDYVPQLCQQCQNAPCLDSEFGDAFYRRADGIVILDPVKAKGRKEIVNACPYGAIHWNDAQQVAQKCTFCAHLLDKGETTPRCVESCPTEALIFGDLEDATSAVSQRFEGKRKPLEVYRPELQAEPLVRYHALPKPFVAGEVILADKPGECACGVRVTLSAALGQTMFTTTTDFLGDFEFKNLESDAKYTLRAELDGYISSECCVRTDKSRNVGAMILSIARQG